MSERYIFVLQVQGEMVFYIKEDGTVWNHGKVLFKDAEWAEDFRKRAGIEMPTAQDEGREMR